MTKFIFTLILCSRIVVALLPSNETLEYIITKIFDNTTESNVIRLLPSENYYNYTVLNNTHDEDQYETEKFKTIMKINLTNGKKLQEISKPVESKFELNQTPEWISHPLREGLKEFRIRPSTNKKCKIESDLYEAHLKNQTLWAIRMAESTQTEIIGIIGGNNYQMGNFEECIKTKAYGVKGKYCLANFKYALHSKYQQKYENMVPKFDFGDINHEASVWETLVRLKKDPARINRQSIYWGICMPASCTSENLEYSLNETLIPRFQERDIQINVTVDPKYCHTIDRLPFTTGFRITIAIMSLLLMMNILSTLYDGYEYLKKTYSNKTEGWREFIAVFSIWRNTYQLGIYNKESQVKIVNGMKVLMMLLIIYGHSLLYILGYPHFNPASLEEVYRRGADIALVNTNIVDVFFTISGFLTFYYGYHPMKIGGIVYLILSIIFRYLRLIPVFAIVIAYVTFVLPYTSDGPIWNAKISMETENCRKNWWLDLLLINNFFNVDEQCVLISWYITTDMQLCIIASILIYFIIKKPKFGLTITVFVFLASILKTFLVTYLNNYNGLLKLYMTLLENPRQSLEFQKLYIALYSRAGPYLVGFMTAYLTIKLQENKFKFSLKTLVLGCICSIAVGEGSQYYGVVFYKFDRPFYLLENALYACLHRILFACLFSWFLLAYLTTGFGILDSIINHRIFTVLGRMTYSVFLMNTLSLITLTASVRTPTFFSYKTIMFIVFGDMVTTYVLGFMFYLYAEAPICGISKLLQKLLIKKFEKQIQEAKINAEKNGLPNKEKKENNFGE